MPGRCAVPHVCGSAWGGLGSPAVGRFMPLAGSFAKVALPSVSSEHWGEARTELCMGFVGSGLPGHADTTGQAGLCWRPEAVSPGPVLTALSRTSGAALTAACAHTRSPGRSPAPGPPGPASASAGDQAWVPVRVGDKALTCSWLPLTGLSCVFLPAVFTALRGSAGSQGHSRCSGSLSTGPQPFASPAGPGAWVLWPPKAQHSPSECPRCTSPALPVRVGSEDAWLFEAEGVAGWRQVASGPADPAAYRAG